MIQENYSVLMSVYFKEKPEYLRQSMDSIHNQTVKTNDFVLVCDGPLSCELDAVIEEMQLKFGSVLNVVRLEKNSGLGNALNVGLRYCKNDLVARMDSDDISFPKRCEKQLDIFQSNKEIVFVSGMVLEFNNSPNKITGIRKLPSSNRKIISFSRRRNPMNHPCVMLKKYGVLKVGGYSEEYHLFEDYYLWVKLLKEGYKAYNLEEALLYMRTPVDIYKRRGGWRYAKNMIRFRWWLYKSSWCNLLDFIVCALPHTIVCLLPVELRMIVYKILH